MHPRKNTVPVETRTEQDTMGTVAVPRDAYFGAGTQRAVDHFPISGQRMPASIIHAFGLVKLAVVRDDSTHGASRL